MRNLNLRISALAMMVVCLPALASAAPPQEAAGVQKPAGHPSKESTVYHVEYTVRELEGPKSLNSRTYALMLSPPKRVLNSNEASGRIRTGSRVPFLDANQQVQRYEDVGINIDCTLDERDSGLHLSTRFESSSAVTPERSTVEQSRPRSPDENLERFYRDRNEPNPIIRQLRLQSDTLILLDRPTVIGTVDDVATNHRYEIQVTVTKVK